jgi:hypothetical protein
MNSKRPLNVMPDSIRHPELIEITGFRFKPGMTDKIVI